MYTGRLAPKMHRGFRCKARWSYISITPNDRADISYSEPIWSRCLSVCNFITEIITRLQIKRRKVQGKDRQIIVKFATRNVRERVFRARKALKDVNQDKDAGKKIYINEDLTKFRAGLAREARSYKNSGLINDTWSIYGKIMTKDNYGHVSVIRTYDDLVKSSEQGNRGHRREAGGQEGTADGRPRLNS